MRRMKMKFFILFAAIGLLLSCKKHKEAYSNIPAIGYKSFTAYDKYSAQMVLTFTDGDGDIGLKPGDTTGQYGSTSPYYYNLYIKEYYKASDGTFKDTAIYDLQTNTIDTGLIRQRVQYVEKTNKEDYLKGEFQIELNGYRQLTSYKTIKYKIYFYDRALHQSNILETPEIQVP